MNEQFGNKRFEKLTKEKTAFNNCREDMSDVNFKIGGVSYTVKVFGCIVLFALFFGGRIIRRRYVGDPDMTFSAGDIIFRSFIAVIAVLVVNAPYTSFNQKIFFRKDPEHKFTYMQYFR